MASRIFRKLIVCALLLSTVLCGCTTAQRGIVGVPGINNYAQVDSKLFRGAAPTETGYDVLKSNHVALVIDLRNKGSINPAEASWATNHNIAYLSVPMSGWLPPSKKTVNSVLQTINSIPGPVMIHCQYGCDRTGTIVACYRISKYHWAHSVVQDEADYYGMSPLEVGMKCFIRGY